MSIRSLLSKLPGRKPALTLERAEEAYAQGRQADAAAMFRALAEQKNVQAQLRLGQLYERGEGVLQSFVEAVPGSAPRPSRSRSRRWRGSGKST